MAEEQPQPGLTQVAKPLSLIPVTIKEAALDSPTFRSTALHFSEQVELIERWLDSYIKSASRLASEASALDSIVNNFLSTAIPPADVSDTVLDHDYTLLALRRYQEGARDWWNSTLKGMKRLESSVCQPVRHFLLGDLRNLKEARRNLDSAQRNFDALVARYASQSKAKEASSLREDAFQLHEARKNYLKASMDFCILAPNVRATLDQLLVKIMAEQWKDMKNSRETASGPFGKWSSEMDRIRGWSKEMESGERIFKRELHSARKQIEDSAELAARPSRELDDYAMSTVPFLGSAPPPSSKTNVTEKPEKQGWLFQRTVSGKPARTVWVRRWFFVKNGIFGWLVQGLRSGAVEESEKIGVLLCGVRPAFQEERRFCFEVKTKDSTIMLQAETQTELTEWISAFDVVKRKALEDPASTETPETGAGPVGDPAFAITPPIAPELAAKIGEGHASHLSEDLSLERSGSLPVPEPGIARGGSFDVIKRPTGLEGSESSSSRDQYARIMQKLDLHRKATVGPALLNLSAGSSGGGGIASLISASHAIMPVGPGAVQTPGGSEMKPPPLSAAPVSTLAPSTLAYPPAPTNLSKLAVVVSGERGLALGKADGGMPGGLLANLWGTTNWGYMSSLERGEIPKSPTPVSKQTTPSPSPPKTSIGEDGEARGQSVRPSPSISPRPRSPSLPSGTTHRKAASSVDLASKSPQIKTAAETYPSYYPVQLRAQDAQFRLLFPYVSRTEKLVLVFRATWNPNDQQEFPGRVYVTANDLYFYSHHLGLVLITTASLTSITEVTAAPGRDCDFIFLHFKEASRQDGATRITIKTFLEPLRLLQRRLNYLVRNANVDGERASLEEMIRFLIKMEVDGSGGSSPSVDSWEDVDVNTPVDGMLRSRSQQELKAAVRIDGTLYPESGGAGVSKNATKFKLPSQPVNYAPQGFASPILEREFNVSAKSLFHVLCGDKSAVFQMLYCGLCADKLVQNPWQQPEENSHYRREIHYQIGDNARAKTVTDHQVIDVYNDHLCYAITDRKVPWYLPASRSFNLLTKIVITHVSKARCKLAIFTEVEWIKQPLVGKALIDARATHDLGLIARDLADLLEDQAGKIKGSSGTSSTRKALTVFGHVGVAKTATQVSASDMPPQSRAQGGEKRLRLRPASLVSLAFEAGSVFASDLLSTVLGGLGAALQAGFKIVSVHGLLVTVILLSGLTNFFFVQKESSAWWRERKALKYMSNLGVGGKAMVMGRAVWLKDIDNYVGEYQFPSSSADDIEFPNGDEPAAGNRCAATFKLALRNTNPFGAAASTADGNVSPFASVSSSASTTLPARLHRTRSNLSTYRHDLLVALRLVNRVEREVVQAEYESWAAAEAMNCHRVGRLIEDKEKQANGNDSKNASALAQLKDMKKRWHGYCSDCYRALKAANGAGV